MKGRNYKGDERWFATNPATGKLEEVDPEGEFSTGETILRLFYSSALDRYVSAPGSLLKVGADGDFYEIEDED